MAVEDDLLGVLKTWYDEKDPGDVFWRNSPTLRVIQKNMIGGKTYNVPLIFSSGSSAGDATVAKSNYTANLTATNTQQFAVTYGQLFGYFQMNNIDILAMRPLKGAWVPLPALRMYQAMDSMRKLWATALFGTGFGEIGQVAPSGYGITPTSITAATTGVTVIVPASYAYKLSIGDTIVWTNGATPGSTLRNVVGTIRKMATPTGVTYPTVTLTIDTSAGTTFTPNATDWIERYGCRSGSTPLLPVGLPAWLPYDRTSLATPFFGVDRSINETSAGQYVARDMPNNEKRIDTVTRAVDAARTGGGIPDYIVTSNYDWYQMSIELQAQANYWQNINTGGKPNKNEVARGIASMSTMFSTSWTQQQWDDPMCPIGYGWLIEKDEMEFVGLTNGEPITRDGITDNQPGGTSVGQASSPDLSFRNIIDNYLTIQPSSLTASGPGVEVILQIFGNFVVHNPSKHCVFKLF